MAKPTYEEMQECVIAFEKAVLHQHSVRPHTSRVLVNQRYVLMGMISELCGPPAPPAGGVKKRTCKPNKVLPRTDLGL